MSDEFSKNESARFKKLNSQIDGYGIAMMACCLLPMAALFFINASWRALVGHDNKQPASNQSTNQSTSQHQFQPTKKSTD